MIFSGREILLKDGRRAVLRAPEAADSEKLIEYMEVTAAETEFLMRYPEEIRYTAEGERAFVSNIRASEYDLMIVCDVDGDIAGNCHLAFQRNIKTAHRATVMIALKKAYWTLGIGGRMLDEMIAAARAEGVKQLELQVMEGNARAIGLYEKKGFTRVAILPGAYRMKDGRLKSEITMIRLLGEENA